MSVVYLIVGIIVLGAITGLGRLVLGALGWDKFEPWDVIVCFLTGTLTCMLLFFGEVIGKALCQ